MTLVIFTVIGCGLLLAGVCKVVWVLRRAMSDETTQAEDITEGLVCQVCGEYFEDVLSGADAPGHPRTCENCK